MGKKKSKGRLKDRGKDRNDFLKTFTIREHDSHVRFELTVDNLKIVAVADLREEGNDKALAVRYYQFSMNNHKYVYCIHLLVEYMRYYAELNKLPLIARLPHSDKAIVDNLSEQEKTQRTSLTNLYLDHEFQQMDDDPNTFISILDPSVHIPKKVDLIGMHYASTNQLIMGDGGSRPSDHRPPEKPVVLEPPTEEAPPVQD